jgi:hypothetical protein
MATIKSYTDLSQSKKLAEILPIESADMHYCLENRDVVTGYEISIVPFIKARRFKGKCNIVDIRPAWSLAALLEQLPYEICDDDGNSSYLQIDKEDDMYQLAYTDPYGDFESIETDRHEDFVDTCYEMIIKLKELNLL